MENDIIPVVGLSTFFFVILAVFVIIRGFRLPESFYEKERKRAVMRMRLVELELAGKEETLRLSKEALGGKKPESAIPAEIPDSSGRKSAKPGAPGK